MIDLDDGQKAVLKVVKDAHTEAEPHHKAFRDRANHFYALYRSYRDWRDSVSEATPRDRERVLRDGQDTFGQELFIPICFKTIETIVPRMLSNAPRMLVLPDDRTAQENVENMKLLIDRQQEQIEYDLKSQDTAKAGLIYGLGIQKSFWRHEYRNRRQLQPLTAGGGYQMSEPQHVCSFDDPDVEDVDPFDFFWDPFAHSAGTMRYAIHRTWRSGGYVRAKLEAGLAGEPNGWIGLDPADMDRLGGSTTEYDQSNRERREAAGMSAKAGGDAKLHEVWEYHDGEQVITVLDRCVPVQKGENPAFNGLLPFHIFRPTTAAIKQVPGIGEIEPIEDLQEEMNEMRTSRRLNAAFALQRVFAYSEGLIEPGDFQVFPGAAIPVNGDPRELLMPLPVQDIPFSSYQEEDRLQADIDGTTGLSDSVTGEGTGGAETATGVQLVEAAASRRIQNKTRRFETETIRPAANAFVDMNQIRILTQREIVVPAAPLPGSAERRWSWVQLGPDELRGKFRIAVEGGSTQPDNTPQKRQDATLLWQTFVGNTSVDQSRLIQKVLEDFDIKDPKAWITQPGSLPPQIMDVIKQQLVQAGMPPDQVQQLLLGALQAVQPQDPNAPAAPAGGGQDQGGEYGGGSQNGSAQPGPGNGGTPTEKVVPQ